MKIGKNTIQWVTVFTLLSIMPSFIYFFDDAVVHWLLHTMSLSASRLIIPLFLLYILISNKVSPFKILKNHTSLIPFLILCFLYFPTYLGDLRFVDKYDWFTVPSKLVFWVLSFGLVINELYKEKD